MNEEKTRLQKIAEQKAKQIRIATEQAIDEGATVTRLCSDEVEIDDVTFCSCSDGSISVILNFRSEKIAKVFEPSKEDLEIMLALKRAQIEEIEKQINAKQ